MTFNYFAAFILLKSYHFKRTVHWKLFHLLLIYIYIYIYAFSRRFYPKRLTLHSSYSFYILSALAFPGNRTHDLGVASAMLYQLSYRKAHFHLKLSTEYFFQCNANEWGPKLSSVNRSGSFESVSWIQELDQWTIIQTCFVNCINWFICDPIQKNDSVMNYLLSWNCQGEPKQMGKDFQWVT